MCIRDRYNVVGSDLTLPEISLVSELIKEAVDPSANIKFGAQIDPDAGDEICLLYTSRCV